MVGTAPLWLAESLSKKSGGALEEAVVVQVYLGAGGVIEPIDQLRVLRVDASVPCDPVAEIGVFCVSGILRIRWVKSIKPRRSGNASYSCSQWSTAISGRPRLGTGPGHRGPPGSDWQAPCGVRAHAGPNDLEIEVPRVLLDQPVEGVSGSRGVCSKLPVGPAGKGGAFQEPGACTSHLEALPRAWRPRYPRPWGCLPPPVWDAGFPSLLRRLLSIGSGVQ